MSGDIILDGAEVKMQMVAQTLEIFNSSNDFTIKSLVNDADLVLKGKMVVQQLQVHFLICLMVEHLELVV